jgi:hypothetical protein
MKTNEEIKNNTRATYIRRALTGALYGFLMGTAFVIVAAFINVWLYPALPIGVEWEQALLRWLLIGLGLTLIGALTSLFSETFPGLAVGAIAAGVLALTAALYISSTGTGLKLMVLIFLLLPIAAMSLPIVWFIRFLMQRHTLALHMKRSVLRIALLVLVAVSAGAFAGYFMKMSSSALRAIQSLQENIQAAASQDNPISETPGFKEHSGMRYVLFQKPSSTSTVGFDVRAEFEDGYSIQCVVVSYPGSPTFLRSCEETP